MPDAHVVAIVGGACAGSTAAEILAQKGVKVVVFEQNPKPYGKIEDGLPRWHKIQRRKEYERIDERLSHDNITFVPLTKLGEDIQFDELVDEWGFSAVLLANGAWKDRPLEVEGVDEYIDKGLIYQNPFIYWFNHKNEKAYDGPQYEVLSGTAIIGGGLASLDVVKAVQMELYEKALKERGIACDMYELEHKGITAFCEKNDIDPESLGVEDATLYYRRRKVDMPLAEPKDRSPEALEKVQMVRQKILDKAMDEFRFHYQERHLPVDKIVEDDRLVGLVFVRTRVEGRKAIPLEGTEKEIRFPLVISSIGSVPEPIPGIEMTGAYYKFSDWDLGIYEAADNVYGVGNTVTGQGNIRLSVKHGEVVANYVADELEKQDKLPEEKVEEVFERVEERQKAVGYTGEYRAWVERMTPPDLE